MTPAVCIYAYADFAHLPAVSSTSTRGTDSLNAENSDVWDLSHHGRQPVGQETIERVRSMLRAIPVPKTYPEWLLILFAIMHALGVTEESIALADAWSSGSLRNAREDSYTGYADVAKACRSFNAHHPNGITTATLVYHARKHGWQDNAPAARGASAPLDANAAALENLQARYALIQMTNGIHLLPEAAMKQRAALGRPVEFSPLKQPDGKLLMRRDLTKDHPQADADKVIATFFVSPATKLYEGVTCDPLDRDKTLYNLWRGPTLKPKKGSWKTIRRFLFNDICNRKKRVYRYLIRYLAHALQKPWEKPGVSITLIGGQGTGKGTVCKILMKIWGATTFQTNRINDIAGGFNQALEGNFHVWLDEAAFGGARATWDEVKSIVTELTVAINAKHQPIRVVPSYIRLWQATNHDFAAMRERDDRRDVANRVSERHKGDRGYWRKVHQAIDGDDEVPAMMRDLLDLDLTNFDVRDKPDTDELVNQKLHSLPPLHKWWLDRLTRGYIDPSDAGGWPSFVSTHILVLEAQTYLSGLPRHTPCDSRAIWDVLRKVCPSARKIQQSAAGSSPNGRERGAALSDLATCRRDFEAYIGGSVSWD